jgi:competence protein ComEC
VSDAAAIVLALSTAGGALVPVPVPLPVALVVVALAFTRRSPVVLCIGAALLASGCSARAWAGLRPPPPHTWSGVATLVSDPGDIFGAVRVDLRVGHRRVEAWARGAAAGRLRDRLAGERVSLAGRLEPLPAGARDRLARRHVAGRLTVDEVGAWSPGGPATRIANGVRRTLLSGAASLPDDRRALFAGFVLGDDREQSVEAVDDFRASGLAHLLVVSGQNVAFVLALASPLLGRLTLGGRLVLAIAVLVLFGFVTRWEPSVLRAEAMTGVALVASTLGRPVSSLRLLALAVTGVLLVDPLLVGSVSFLLSAGACAGIALLARPLAAALPGPRPLASALAVTLAAQVGVAPVLVPVFGGLPVAAVPANLLAVPAAGPVMMWGLAAGLPAGLVGGAVARVVHVPTGLLVAWVAAVARVSARLPLGELRLPHVAVVTTSMCLLAVPEVSHRRVRAAALLTVVATLAAPTFLDRSPRRAWAEPVVRGVRLWQVGGASVVELDRASPATLLPALRRWRVRRIDVLVLARRSTAGVAATVTRRVPARVVLADADTEVDAGALRVRVERQDTRLVAVVRLRPSE